MTRAPLQIGFLASHGGSGMRAVLEAAGAGKLAAEGVLMISNNEKAEAHRVAADFGVPSITLNGKHAGGDEELDLAIADALSRAGAELIVLSGYMRLIGPETLKRFPRRILNIHPALLPKFGGQGMYGDLVHEAVLAANEDVSGATVHLVDDQYDHGQVLLRREVPVLPEDDLAALRARVRAVEGPLYVETLAAIASGAISLDG
jgi:phosphoribosylglycinamide formyltransferase-1